MSWSELEARRHGSPLPLNSDQLLHEPARVREMAAGLNKLSGMEFNQLKQLSHRPPTAVQELVLGRLRNAADMHGGVPEDLDPDSALRELMRTHSQYGDPSNLATFDASKLKILKSKFKPKPLSDLLPPHVMPLFRRRHNTILKSPEEVDRELREHPHSCPKQPYWDPILKSDENVRGQFIGQLNRVGIVGFARSIRASVGLFFVKKKDPAYIRMVVDARISNFHHVDPPITRLGSGANFSDLELNKEILSTKLGCVSNDHVGYGAELDVADCFWQFRVDELAEWFGIRMPRAAKVWTSFGADTSKFDPEEIIYPVITAMAMGWKWALFFANEVVASITKRSQRCFPLELREKMPVGQLWEAPTITSVYVDNVAVIGAREKDVQDRISAIEGDFTKLGIPVVLTYEKPVKVFETVGIVLDFEHKVVSNKSRRVWRVHLAGRALCRRRKVWGHAVEVWLGHATSIFRLAPHFLAIFDKIYRFVQTCRDMKVPLWPSVRSEIRNASSLVWLAFTELGGDIVRSVDIGDSSQEGYALLTRECSSSQVLAATRFKEKWRFVALPQNLKNAIERKHVERHSGGEASEDFEDVLESVGVGVDTEYGRWLAECLVEGSWIRTSALRSQYRARPSKRVDVEIPTLVPPLPGDMVDAKHFRVVWARKWRWVDEHINIKEGRVLVSSLKRFVRIASLFGCKKLSLGDNLPSLLALDKGRSSSPAMNKLCRVSASLIGATGARWRLRHVETERNAADKPSRLFSKKNRQWVLSEFTCKNLSGKHNSYCNTKDSVGPLCDNAPEGEGTCQLDRCCPDPDGVASLVGPNHDTTMAEEPKLSALQQNSVASDVFPGGVHLPMHDRKPTGSRDDANQKPLSRQCPASSGGNQTARKRLQLSILVPPPGLSVIDSKVTDVYVEHLNDNHNAPTCPEKHLENQVRDIYLHLELPRECGPPRARDQESHFPSCGKLSEESGRPKIGSVGDDGHCSVLKLKRRPVVWEVFSGMGQLSRSFKSHGFDVKPPIDLQNRHFMDLSVPGTQKLIRDAIENGWVDYIHFGTPCTVFSRARRNIKKIIKARNKEMLGCELAAFTAEMCALATVKGIKWSIENPKSSRLWEFPDIHALFGFEGSIVVCFDMCMYNQKFKKPTMILTNAEELGSLSRKCCHKKHEVILCGKTRVQGSWRNRTELAGAYPKSLCDEWSRAVKSIPFRCHDSSQPCPDNDTILQRLEVGFVGKNAEGKRSYAKVPSKDLEYVIFGQCSKAEANKKRQCHKRQRWAKAREKKVREGQ